MLSHAGIAVRCGRYGWGGGACVFRSPGCPEASTAARCVRNEGHAPALHPGYTEIAPWRLRRSATNSLGSLQVSIRPKDPRMALARGSSSVAQRSAVAARAAADVLPVLPSSRMATSRPVLPASPAVAHRTAAGARMPAPFQRAAGSARRLAVRVAAVNGPGLNIDLRGKRCAVARLPLLAASAAVVLVAPTASQQADGDEAYRVLLPRVQARRPLSLALPTTRCGGVRARRRLTLMSPALVQGSCMLPAAVVAALEAATAARRACR